MINGVTGMYSNHSFASCNERIIRSEASLRVNHLDLQDSIVVAGLIAHTFLQIHIWESKIERILMVRKGNGMKIYEWSVGAEATGYNGSPQQRLRGTVVAVPTPSWSAWRHETAAVANVNVTPIQGNNLATIGCSYY